MPPARTNRDAGGIAGGMRAARGWSGMTLGQLAEASGYTRQTLSYAENGSQEPTLDVIRAVAEATGVPVEVIVGGLDRIILTIPTS